MAKAASAPAASPVRIGVVGHGVVGSAFTALVARQAETIAARTGVALSVSRIAVRDASKHPNMIGDAKIVTDPLVVQGSPPLLPSPLRTSVEP